jgi:hypothetical protein
MSGKGEGIEKRSFLNNGLSDIYRCFFISTKLTQEYVIFLGYPLISLGAYKKSQGSSNLWLFNPLT